MATMAGRRRPFRRHTALAIRCAEGGGEKPPLGDVGPGRRAERAVAREAQGDARAVEGSRGGCLNGRPVVAPKRDVGPVEDRADLLDRVVCSRGGEKLSIVRYTCQLDEGVVPPARQMRMARVG